MGQGSSICSMGEECNFDTFNLNDSPTALPRACLPDRQGFRFTSPLERSELSFSTVLGEVKYNSEHSGGEYLYSSARPCPCRSGGRADRTGLEYSRFQEIFYFAIFQIW